MKDTEKIDSLNLSRRLDFATLRKQVSDKIAELNADQGVLVLIDAFGGTSYNTAVPLMDEHNIALVTGVNLPMLLSAVTNRKRLSLANLSKKIAEDAKKTISVISRADVQV